jgi:hypothetical protein
MNALVRVFCRSAANKGSELLPRKSPYSSGERAEGRGDSTSAKKQRMGE